MTPKVDAIIKGDFIVSLYSKTDIFLPKLVGTALIFSVHFPKRIGTAHCKDIHQTRLKGKEFFKSKYTSRSERVAYQKSVKIFASKFPHRINFIFLCFRFLR